MEIRPFDPITIVGAGTMGLGIAQIAATIGHRVALLDIDEDALDSGRSRLAAMLDAAVARGRFDEAMRNQIWGRIRWSSDPALASGSRLVIEAIVEKLEAKRQLYWLLEQVIGRDTILASNTSSLSIGTLAKELALPGRFLGLHFFNPVPAMKLVEIVPAPKTRSAVIEAATELMKSWGKKPVLVRDVAGFIVNRVARPYYAEAFVALGEGIEPAIVDTAMTRAGGFRMGPLALADLIGHDVNYAVALSVHAARVGRERFRPQAVQQALVDEGKFGCKSGRGVYDYQAPEAEPPYVPVTGRPGSIKVANAGALQLLVDATHANGLRTVADDGLAAEQIEVDGLRIALGDGRPLADREDVDVLLDHARHFATADVMAITVRQPEHATIVSNFLDAIGRRTLLVRDRPGQLVLRMLAQLANAAADTSNDAIASAKDVEEAMIHGANHLEGPLAWAQRTGFNRVKTLLANIAEVTGDPLYEPSPLFSGA